jgi:hypothetical protein
MRRTRPRLEQTVVSRRLATFFLVQAMAPNTQLTGENQAVNIWKRWATDVRGSVIQSRHVESEGKPQDVLAAMVPFLR